MDSKTAADIIADPLALTQDELKGVLQFRSQELIAKGNLCDAQHKLQQAQAEVEQAQRQLALVDAQMGGLVLGIAAAHGITDGRIGLSQDGTRLERQ